MTWDGDGYKAAAKRATQWSFTLDYPRPLKGLSANDRPHWATKAKSTATIRHEVFVKVRALKVPALDRVRVETIWFVNTNHRRDEDNLAPFLKAIYDGIGADRGVSARIVEDDTAEFMEKIGARIVVDKTVAPHFEVTITALEALT